MRKRPNVTTPEFWTAPAIALTADELAVLQELQKLGGFTSFANVQRCALAHLTKHYGVRVPADVWAQR